MAVTFHLTDKTTGLGDFVGPVFFELASVEKLRGNRSSVIWLWLLV
ncbi:hypothetical protein RESH_02644 [Rhodopirellula europaea SH398]|uniref:Uncharacterized protein n=1 Tax=Rhodopirellula europaea SH398 TaxID=1263868 RepID=M5S5L5_9BACT|nr:hypothetical protein RESH_02644 [Rhodopirellula europaea SH398]